MRTFAIDTFGRSLPLLAASALLLLASCTQSHVFDPETYPTARRDNVVDQLHGQSVADPYRWLEDEQSEETQAWIDEQNKLRETWLAHFEPQREQIAAELEKIYGVDAVSNIVPRGSRYFVLQRQGLENHAKIMVMDDSPTAEHRVVLNPNTFSKDGTVAMDWFYPSPDGKLIAYGKSAHGSEKSTLYIRNVQTNSDLPDEIPFTQYCSVAWNADGTGFYYNRCPDPATVPAGEENFHMKVYFHQVGTSYKLDRYVWGKDRPIDEEPRPYASSDHQYILLNFYRDPSRDDLYFGPMNSTEPLKPIADGLNAITEGNIVDGHLFLRTNLNAPRYRICTTTVDKPGHENWRDIIPQQTGVIDAFRIIDHKLIVRIVENVRARLMVYELDGDLIEEIPLPALGSVSSMTGSLNNPDLFFTFSSWVIPTAVYQYNLRTHKTTKLNQRVCPVDLSKYETKQVWATSADGTRVPMFIVANRDTELNGQNPALLYGYGGFNVSLFPNFRPRIIPFLERGGVWALANIRGGGELGQQWHDGGRRESKQNCFNDFYAAGQKLIDLGYTKPHKLACKGGSNGGLLIGAAVAQRPDLFQAALSQVPLMDMLRFHLWGMGAQWVHEYGDPENPEEFKWLLAYSPYHNVHANTDYPATLIVTAEADNRVDTAHAFKMTAALQEATSGNRPIFIRVERKAGHGAGKPLSMQLQQLSEDWIFLMWQLGMFN